MAKPFEIAAYSRYFFIFQLIINIFVFFPKPPLLTSDTQHLNSSVACLRTGPWASHPRRVLRQLRREVSLYPVPVIAFAGSNPGCFCIGIFAHPSSGVMAYLQVWLRLYEPTTQGTLSDELLYSFVNLRFTPGE